MLSNCGAGEDSWETLDSKEIKSVNPKGNQLWIFIGRTDAEAETPILWPLYGKSWLIGKDPDAGKDWRQKEKGTREDKMARWHHWLNRHEFEQTPGDSGGQGGLTCCSPWVTKNWTQLRDWTTTISSLPGVSWCAPGKGNSSEGKTKSPTAGTSQQCEQVPTANSTEAWGKEAESKGWGREGWMLFRQVSDWVKQLPLY